MDIHPKKVKSFIIFVFCPLIIYNQKLKIAIINALITASYSNINNSRSVWQHMYRKVPNRRRASIEFFEFRSALLFKNFKILCSKISLKSFFCALLFKPRLYLNRSSIWNITVCTYGRINLCRNWLTHYNKRVMHISIKYFIDFSKDILIRQVQNFTQ